MNTKNNQLDYIHIISGRFIHCTFLLVIGIPVACPLFFECTFARHLWNWLFSITNISMQFSNCLDFWKILDRNWSSQCKTVLKACMFNIICTVWIRRNHVRFKDKQMHWKPALNMIIVLFFCFNLMV